jgi:hypothetical protein
MNTKTEKESLVTEIKANTIRFILLAEKMIQYKSKKGLTETEKVDYFRTATDLITVKEQGDKITLELMSLLDIIKNQNNG